MQSTEQSKSLPYRIGLLLGAGEGTRLSSLGVPKALVTVGGIPLYERALENLYQMGAQEVVVGLPKSLEGYFKNLNKIGPFSRDKVHFYYINTPSSLHTLDEVYRFWLELESTRSFQSKAHIFIVGLIDSVLTSSVITSFAKALNENIHLNLLLVSRFVDDEKPLWVELAEKIGFQKIPAIFPISQIGADSEKSSGATAGLYVFQRETLKDLPNRVAKGAVKLRTFLSKNQAPFFAFLVEKVVDVDRPEDVLQAESCLQNE